MPRTVLYDEVKAAEKKAQRIKRRAGNIVSEVLASNAVPISVKREWTKDLEQDAKGAFTRLLVGSTHVCPACGHDAGPRNSKGVVYACGCDRPNVHALRLYCELTGDVGPGNQFVIQLNQQLGVRNEQELHALVAQGRRLSLLGEMTPESAGDSAVESLRVVIPHSSPETRRRWAGALAGLWNAVEAAEDEPANGTNGHGGPH